MNTTNIPDELLDKLNKLKNMADGAAAVGSMEEAANAAAKYQAMLLKYNLEESQVLEHGIAKKAQMLMSELTVERNIYKVLLRAVAKSCMCRTVCDGANLKHFWILGEKHNVAATEYLFEQILIKIAMSSSYAWKSYAKSGGTEKRHNYVKSFQAGCIDMVVIRLHKQEEEIKKETVAGQSMAVMIVNKTALATRFMTDKFPNLINRSRSYTAGNSRSGYSDGQQAGKNLEFNRGLGNASGSKMLE